MLKFLNRFFKWTFVSVFILLSAGIAFKQCARRQLENGIEKGKTFVEIDGHKIHYVKKGIGKYTVVFQSGMGSKQKQAPYPSATAGYHYQ